MPAIRIPTVAPVPYRRIAVMAGVKRWSMPRTVRFPAWGPRRTGVRHAATLRAGT